MADKNINLLNVAIDCGYQSQSGFIRAFEKMFSCRPKDFRKKQDEHLTIYKGVLVESFEILKRDDVWVVYARALGDYEASSAEAWQELDKEAKKAYAKIKEDDPAFELSLTFDNAEVIGICYDNPDTTESDKIRYEACVSAEDETAKLLSKYGMQVKRLNGGKFAKMTFIGNSDKEIWLGFYKRVCDDGYTIRDEPPFEKYLSNPATTPWSELKMELYIGVE